jgi:hypothetical protein
MRPQRAFVACVLAGLAGSITLMHAESARAYCQTTTCDPATECKYDRTGCATVGLPLQWKKGCVTYSVHRAGSPTRNISYDRAHSITERAFGRWLDAECEGGSPSLRASDKSPVSCDEPEYNSSDGNANIIMFRDDDWPYAGANATLALTTITFNFETGEIFDADIEINSFKTPLTTGDVAVDFDLESIITHETGHFLGLSHSHVPDATMYLEYGAGDITLRDLEPDDVAGICATYPPNRQVLSQDCTPRHGFSPECSRPKDDGGCALRPGSPSSTAHAWPLALLAWLVARAARRRKRTSA